MFIPQYLRRIVMTLSLIHLFRRTTHVMNVYFNIRTARRKLDKIAKKNVLGCLGFPFSSHISSNSNTWQCGQGAPVEATPEWWTCPLGKYYPLSARSKEKSNGERKSWKMFYRRRRLNFQQMRNRLICIPAMQPKAQPHRMKILKGNNDHLAENRRVGV